MVVVVVVAAVVVVVVVVSRYHCYCFPFYINFLIVFEGLISNF